MKPVVIILVIVTLLFIIFWTLADLWREEADESERQRIRKT